MEHGFRMFCLGFIVADQSALVDKPTEGALNDPTPVQDHEAFGVLISADDIPMQPTPGTQSFDPSDQGSS